MLIGKQELICTVIKSATKGHLLNGIIYPTVVFKVDVVEVSQINELTFLCELFHSPTLAYDKVVKIVTRIKGNLCNVVGESVKSSHNVKTILCFKRLVSCPNRHAHNVRWHLSAVNLKVFKNGGCRISSENTVFRSAKILLGKL